MAAAQTSQSQATDPKKKTTTTERSGDLTVDQIVKIWMAFFDSHDVNRDQRWSREEQISAVGMTQLAFYANQIGTDSEGYITREKFEVWVRKEAPDYVKKHNDVKHQHEDEIRRLEDAYVKATADAKARIQQNLQNARNRYDNHRYQQHYPIRRR